MPSRWAEGYARLGRRVDALRWVRRAIARGFLNYPFWNEHSQDLARLRDDAEYQALLSGVKPRWEGLVAWEQAREAAHGRRPSAVSDQAARPASGRP